MRRQLILILTLLLGTAAIAWAQDDDPEPGSTPEGLEPLIISEHTISGRYNPVTLEPIIPPYSPDSINISANDQCSEAAPLDNLPIGGQTTTNSMTSELSDPELSCMWGIPTSTRGWRSVWYLYKPERSGLISIDTRGSKYDTVLSVHTGSCGQLVEAACNDDSNFFISQVTFSVLAGVTYYIEVADWQAGTSGEAVLNFAAQELPVPSKWSVVFDGPSTQAMRSRHATAVVGDKIYVIGGQTTVGDTPVRTPATDVYNSNNGTWTSRANMPAGGGFGYSNTSAAYVASKGKIYIPSGYIGNIQVYDGNHWSYDIATDFWSANPANNNWAAGGPTIYSGVTAYRWPDSTDGYFLSGGLTGIFPPEPPVTSTGWIAHDEVYYYSATNNNWNSKLITPTITGRFGHAAGIVPIGGQDNLCLAGGMGEDPTVPNQRFVFSRVECLNIAQNSWTEVAPLNYQRYFPGSAVDSFGNWYVFGGYDANGGVVAITERYDPDRNQWFALDVRFDLGILSTQDPSRPPRAWPSGGFVNQNLFAIGGEAIQGQVLNLVERISLPNPRIPPISQLPPAQFMPIIIKKPVPIEGDNTFASANFLPLNSPQRNRFITADDNTDVFTFQVPSRRNVTVRLKNLASTNELSLYLYTFNKDWIAISAKPGTQDEVITETLNAGQYFAVVERIFPPAGIVPDQRDYQIEAQG